LNFSHFSRVKLIKFERNRFQTRTARRGDEGANPLRPVERSDHSGVAGGTEMLLKPVSAKRYVSPSAVGGHAGVVRGGVSGERQVGRHHVRAVRPGDPARNRHLQPPAPPQTPPRHPGECLCFILCL